MQSAAQLLPAEALGSIAAWLHDNASAHGHVRAVRCAGGFSNLTFRLLDDGGRSWILRRPPIGHGSGPAHDILREAGVLRALGHSGVPVPAVLLTSLQGPDVGFPYAVVEYVAGDVLVDRQSVESYPHPSRRTLGLALMTVLAQIHAIQPEHSGIERRSRSGSHLMRQIAQWSSTGDGIDSALEDQLVTAASTQDASPTLVHGDFHLGNIIVRSDGKIGAVLDWEMATIGDPLVDLGCALAYWQQPDDDPRLAPLASGASGFPSRREMAAAYGVASGTDLDRLDTYVAFGHWKLSRIAADILARMEQGAMGALELDPAMLQEQVVVRRALAIGSLAGVW